MGDHRTRFVLVGGVNTAVGYAVFALAELFLFAGMPFGYMLALVLSYVIGIAVAFGLYRAFVFRDALGWRRSLPRFISVYLAAIGLNALLLPLFVAVLGLHPLLAQALCLVATTLMSYVGHRWFSFQGGRKRVAPRPESR